jgi:hypothetical protein
MLGVVNGLMVTANLTTSIVIFLISIWFMYDVLGGYIVLIPIDVGIILVIQRYVYLKAKGLRHKIFWSNDQRGSCWNEIFDNFNFVKLSCFESRFQEKIWREREQESKSMRKYLRRTQVSEMISYC